nr:alanine racemase [Pelagibacterium montanilacus]
MSLPLLSLDRGAFTRNSQTLIGHLNAHGALLAPHAKTPMVPELARRLVDAGAWGASVADIRQAGVLADAGHKRLIIANQVGGMAAARRLAARFAGRQEMELHVFVDSIEAVSALRNAWDDRSDLPLLGLLIEVGGARAGLRDTAGATAVLDHALAAERSGVYVSGSAAYEGAVASGTPEVAGRRVDELLDRLAGLHAAVREKVGPGRELIVTAGGSAWFDRVLARLGDLAHAPQTKLILRSGAIFFSDHGVYERALEQMAKRSAHPEGRFAPALRVWAEVLSTPETGLVICGMGIRDVSSDIDLPIPLAIWRDGKLIAEDPNAKVVKLNDQHAFLEVSKAAGDRLFRVGDVIEFGISHPCTCIDRHGVIWEVDDSGAAVGVLRTMFG